MSISTFPHGQSPPAGGWLVPVPGGNISCSQGKGGWGWCSGGGEEAHPLLQELRSDCNTEQQPREEKQPTTDTSPESLPSSPCAHHPLLGPRAGAAGLQPAPQGKHFPAHCTHVHGMALPTPLTASPQPVRSFHLPTERSRNGARDPFCPPATWSTNFNII